MTKVRKRTFSLTAELADFIDRKVAAGAYVSSSEVVREGLRTMQDRDAAVEKWLKEEVVPAIAAYESDPGRLETADEAFKDLLSEIDE